MNADVKIHAAVRKGITYLKGSYFTPPMKVADVTEDRNVPELRLMLVSSSPGVLDGDEYVLRVELDEQCIVNLSTQSYQRLFMMRQGAKQVMEVQLKNNASFTYLPHPMVPHQSSVFNSHNRIYLLDGCRLIWGEIITCGRNLRGEVFKFAELISVTEVFKNNKLVLKENLRLSPAQQNLNALGRMEGFTHQATLIYLEEKPPQSILKECINSFLSQEREINYGISTPPCEGLIVRILGHRGEQLLTCLKKIAEMIDKVEIGADRYENQLNSQSRAK